MVAIWKKGMILWLLLCIVFICLVDLFTFKPNVISGNGNLGLIFVVPALVLFLLFARSLWQGLGMLEVSSSLWMKTGWGAFSLFFLFCFLEYQFVIHLIASLGGSPEMVSSKIYRYPWLNQYTNTIFINFYTLSIMGTGVTVLKIILGSVYRKN
jgi:hypothetical protein